MMNRKEDLGSLIKQARKKKGLSARKLADLCDVSHTEINNIEKGLRIKPSLLTLKGFEKYLDLPFKKTAKMVGYADETIKYGMENIIVSYEMYDKFVQEKREEEKMMMFFIDQKRHIAADTKEYFNDIHNYLKKQPNIDEKLLRKADAIVKLLTNIEKKYESILKRK